MLISMTTRRSIHQFITEQCERGDEVASPTVAFMEALRRWAPGAGHQAPTPRFIKKVLSEDYGISAVGSRHDWVFVGVTLKPVQCRHCRGVYDPEDRVTTKRHLLGSCDRV